MFWASTAPRDRISMTLPSKRIKLLLLGAYPRVSPPQNLRFATEAWTRRDSNPHLLPSRGAVFPLHHGPTETVLLSRERITHLASAFLKCEPKTGITPRLLKSGQPAPMD